MTVAAAETSSSRSYEATRLLAALRTEGCPVCHEIEDHDRGYFFWFFSENYFEAHTLESLTRSLGFCLAHAAGLAEARAGAYQLAQVHRVMARRVRAILAASLTTRSSGLTRYETCPPCRSRAQAGARAAFWVQRLLEDPVDAERYARPGILCAPHLRVVVPRVSRHVLERLLVLHEGAMTRATTSPADALRTLSLAVGHKWPVALPRLDDAGASPGKKDPVGDLLDVLGRGVACPVCLEVRRVWIERGRWLEEALREGRDVEDLLPACAEHVWAMVDVGGPGLVAAAASHALRLATGEVSLAVGALRAQALPGRHRPLRRLTEAVLGPHRRLRRAREVLARDSHCSVCRRLSLAEARTLELLFVLVDDPRLRPVVSGGYGLCLKHFARAMGLAPAPAVRRALVEIEIARLARLEWELEEAARKVGWESRPEAPGTETTAWRRALAKFSGSLTGDD